MNARARMILFGGVAVLSLVLALTANPGARAIGLADILVDNLAASWTAPGGGGVYSAYRAAGTYDLVSPGTTALFDGREAGIIKAGLTSDSGYTDDRQWDEGLFGFQPNVTINVFAAGALTYDVENQYGTNPVWMTFEIEIGDPLTRDDNASFQHVPAPYGAGWNTVDAAAGQWQMMDANGNGTGPLVTLADLAADAAYDGHMVIRAYLRLGMGPSYYGTNGTVGWVDKVTIGDTTYDFVVPAYWYVTTTGSDSNEGTLASPFLTIQHAVDMAASGDTIHVAAGTYNESLITIGKSLTVTGADTATTIIDGGGVAASGHDGLIKIAHVTTGPVTFEGFTLQNSGGDLAGTIALITIDHNSATSPVTVQNNHFVGRSAYTLGDMGVWSYSTDGALTVQNNQFDHMWQGILFERPRGGASALLNNFHHLYPYAYTTTLYEPEGIFAFTYSGDNISNLLALNGNTFSNYSGEGIAVGGGYGGLAPAKFSNVQIQDNDIDAIGSGLERRHVGIYLINYGADLAQAPNGGVANAIISGNTFGAGGADSRAIWISGRHANVTIEENIISGVNMGIATDEKYAGAGFVQGLAVHNNFIDGNTTGVSNGSTAAPDMIDASGNWWGCTGGPAAAGCDPVTANVDYTPWLISGTDTGAGAGFQGDFSVLNADDGSPQYGPAGIIQEAANLVTAGGTVNVAAGTYSGNVVLNRSVHLMGDPGDGAPGPGPNAPLIDGGSTNGSGFFIENGTSYVSIRGFEVANYTSNDNGIGNAVSAWEASTAHIAILDNYFHDLGWNAVLVGNDGGLGDHTYWTIQNNVVEDSLAYGLELTNASNSVIEDNVVHTNGSGTGILIVARRNESNISILDNVVDGSIADYVDGGRAGIYVLGWGFEIPGVNLNSVTLTGNTVSTTGSQPGIWLRDRSTGTVTNVTMHTNSINTLLADVAAAVDAQKNWWGAADSATASSHITGTGAAVVDFRPWCGESACTSFHWQAAGDFDGLAHTDLAVLRPSDHKWLVKDQFTVAWHVAGDIPVPGDYDHDGEMDVAVYRPSDGKWYVKDLFNVAWGIPGDIPVPGDYDGDGTTDLAVFRPSDGKWYVKDVFNIAWGQSGDIPVPADYDDDGVTELAVLRPSDHKWYIKDLPTVRWYEAGDIPVPADYDEDGDAEVAVYRPSDGKWYVKDLFNIAWGIPGDLPVPGDFDANALTDLAVFRPSDGKWYVRGQFNIAWGTNGDWPLVAPDTNGDGDPYQ